MQPASSGTLDSSKLFEHPPICCACCAMSKFYGLFGCDNDGVDESEEEEGEYHGVSDEDEDIPADEKITCEELAKMETSSELKEPEKDNRIELLIKSNLCCICKSKDVKYRCPKCSLRTCSLVCCKKHKEVFTCDGVRDACPFLKISEFTDKNLVDDYFFLERANSAIESAARKRRDLCCKSRKSNKNRTPFSSRPKQKGNSRSAPVITSSPASTEERAQVGQKV